MHWGLGVSLPLHESCKVIINHVDTCAIESKAQNGTRISGVTRFSVSVGGAYMNINEFPGHARGTENFSLCSLFLSRFNGILHLQTTSTGYECPPPHPTHWWWFCILFHCFFECSLHFLLPGDSQLKHNDHLSTDGPNMMFGHKEAMVISCGTSAGPQIPLTFWWQEGPHSSMASLPDEPGQLLWCYWTGSVFLQPFAYYVLLYRRNLFIVLRTIGSSSRFLACSHRRNLFVCDCCFCITIWMLIVHLSSLSLRRHTHGPLAKRLMHMTHFSGNTSGVSKSSSDWLN